ncbi:IS30 family transposase [Listeria seeligeri]|uniref:IS30 family transposase n=1 Tax=Listeria seeligeri TaxID=1640 RepID=UPI0022EC1416|nr:IS30 family transposase [Listeria seeligeri]
MRFGHLSAGERGHLRKYQEEGKTQQEIATLLYRSQSTISRELKRNSENGRYHPDIAQVKYEHKMKNKRNRSKYTSELKQQVEERLKKRWSPEQIAGRFSLEGTELGFKTIYRWLYEGKLLKGELHHLRRRGKSRQKKETRGSIKDKKNIRERPREAYERARKGDWEGDTVVSKKGKTTCLVTLVDRQTRFLKAQKIANRYADVVAMSIQTLLGNAPTETITVDNGKEFAAFKRVEASLQTSVYFADPFASWQRGTNENTNGLLRDYFRKGMDLAEVTEEELQAAVNAINSRPRKVLGWRTAEECYLNSS